MREPISYLTEQAILNQPHYTDSITKVWLARMIDAGWVMWFREPGTLFRHADAPVKISQVQAEILTRVFWKRLLIPSPYNLDEILNVPLVKLEEAKPLGWKAVYNQPRI